MATIEERLNALEVKMKALEQSINVTEPGVVKIATPGRVILKAAVLEFYAAASAVMQAGSVDVSASMNLNLKSAAVTQVQGSVVRFNGGSRPVAYSGSQVVPTFPPLMKVDHGNHTVLV